MTAKDKDILALIEMFEASDWRELRVNMDGVQLLLSKDSNARMANVRQLPATASVAAPVLAQPVPTAKEIPAHWTAVTAPNLGTFYRAAKPGLPPMVEIGQTVTPDSEICLLEVMKLFTAVKAGVSGIVRHVCVADAEMVKHGQPLFYLET